MKIKVAELFAGVGGFRIGLEKASDKFKIVWSNQWEPKSKGKQDASEIYIKRFGEKNHSNIDINLVQEKDIADHHLLVGGFPCQDYSVATTLKNSHGLYGKKGVLWWQIYRILEEKGDSRPDCLLFENVDRLLGSPSTQKGRDMAVILSSLHKLGYIVEWRVINAADYGMPQKRKRIFILGYKKNSKIFNKVNSNNNVNDWLIENGVFAKAFPIENKEIINYKEFKIITNFKKLSDEFNISNETKPFQNTGILINNKITTFNSRSSYNGKRTLLRDILVSEKEISDEFYLDLESIEKWRKLKNGQNTIKFNKKLGYNYKYSEGKMSFPDDLNKPCRTIITGEGGASPSRFKHVVEVIKGKPRRLTPIELERANMFPDNHTIEASNIKRAFIMGNALVTGVVEKIGKALIKEL